MRRKCAWCDRDLGPVAPFDNAAITHTICVLCSARLLNALRQTLQPPAAIALAGLTPLPLRQLRRRHTARRLGLPTLWARR